MQYQDRRRASLARASMRVILAVLGILTVVAFECEADGLTEHRWACLCVFVIVMLLCLTGGFCDVGISVGDSFIDISCQQIFNRKGRVATYSIDMSRITSWNKVSFIFFHYLTIHYVSHFGHHKTARIGLTMVPAKVRRRLIDALKQNATRRQ